MQRKNAVSKRMIFSSTWKIDLDFAEMERKLAKNQ